VQPSAQRVVDAHVHLWDRSRFTYAWLDGAGEVLERNFGPADLALSWADAGSGTPESAVFVQADCDAAQALDEAAWVQGLADAGAPIRAIVAAASLELGDGVAPHLDALCTVPLVSGVRRLTQDEAPGFMTTPEFIEGVACAAGYGLSIDLCVRSRQLPEVADLVEALPQAQFVLDHLGKPRIEEGSFGTWASDIARIAASSNVRCKLSGLATEAPRDRRQIDDLLPWITFGLETFGPERAMFGSDWPVLTLAADYGWWLDCVRRALGNVSPADAQRVMAGTAEQTYDPIALRRKVGSA